MYKYKIWLLFIFLTGCASFTPPAEKTQIDLEASKSYWFTYDASRRGALMLPKDENGDIKYKICSEPAPDIAFKTVAGIENKLSYGELDNETKANITSEVIQLAERGQTIQFLRESLFRLCELSINTNLSSDTLEEVYLKILDTALRLQSDSPFKIDALKLEHQIAKAKESQVLAEAKKTESELNIQKLSKENNMILAQIKKSDEAKKEELVQKQKEIEANILKEKVEIEKAKADTLAATKKLEEIKAVTDRKNQEIQKVIKQLSLPFN